MLDLKFTNNQLKQMGHLEWLKIMGVAFNPGKVKKGKATLDKNGGLTIRLSKCTVFILPMGKNALKGIFENNEPIEPISSGACVGQVNIAELKRLSHACGNGLLIPATTSINIEGSLMVATDGYRLAMACSKSIYIEKAQIPVLTTQCPYETCYVYQNGAFTTVQWVENHYAICIQQPMDNFPNWERVMPDSFDHCVELSPESLLLILKECEGWCEWNCKRIALQLSNGFLTLSCNYLHEPLRLYREPVNYAGPDITINLNVSYLIDALESGGHGPVLMKWNADNKPVMFSGPMKLELVMPMISTNDFEPKKQKGKMAWNSNLGSPYPSSDTNQDEESK